MSMTHTGSGVHYALYADGRLLSTGHTLTEAVALVMALGDRVLAEAVQDNRR